MDIVNEEYEKYWIFHFKGDNSISDVTVVKEQWFIAKDPMSNNGIWRFTNSYDKDPYLHAS